MTFSCPDSTNRDCSKVTKAASPSTAIGCLAQTRIVAVAKKRTPETERRKKGGSDQFLLILVIPLQAALPSAGPARKGWYVAESKDGRVYGEDMPKTDLTGLQAKLLSVGRLLGLRLRAGVGPPVEGRDGAAFGVGVQAAVR